MMTNDDEEVDNQEIVDRFENRQTSVSVGKRTPVSLLSISRSLVRILVDVNKCPYTNFNIFYVFTSGFL